MRCCVGLGLGVAASGSRCRKGSYKFRDLGFRLKDSGLVSEPSLLEMIEASGFCARLGCSAADTVNPPLNLVSLVGLAPKHPIRGLVLHSGFIPSKYIGLGLRKMNEDEEICCSFN